MEGTSGKEEKEIISLNLALISDSGTSSDSESESGDENADKDEKTVLSNQEEKEGVGSTASEASTINNTKKPYGYSRLSEEKETKQDGIFSNEGVRTKIDSAGPEARSETHWRSPTGFNQRKLLISEEGNFQRYPKPNYTKKTSASFKGNWCLNCDDQTVDDRGKTEADAVWRVLYELHKESSTLFQYPPSRYRRPDGKVVAINCCTPDYRNIENIMQVAKAIHNRIHYPYIMYYFGPLKKHSSYMYTLEGELYESTNTTWKFMKQNNDDIVRNVSS